MPELDDDNSNDNSDDTSVNDAAAEDQDQDDAGAGEDQETDDNTDSDDDDDSTTDDSDSDASDDDSGDTTDNDAEDEDDDDDDDFDPTVPRVQPDATQDTENFDIRKLPRDPTTGLLDPVEANKAIQEFMAKRDAARDKQAESTAETRSMLEKQWGKVKDQYPHIWKNKRLVEEVRDKHLNSFGPGKKYLSPTAAAKAVAKLYNLGVKSGQKSARSKRTVETLVRTSKGSGGKPAADGTTEYATLRKQALDTSNPQKAKAARIELLKIRRQARQSGS